MKKVLLSMIVSFGAVISIYGQCCNVVSSNGLSAVSRNSICVVTASGIGADCGELPDTDGDGVPDKDDLCRNTPGIAENKGCPAISEDEVALLKEAIHGIKFETGSDVIKEESYPMLDLIVKIMDIKKFYKLNIEGHTDSSGDDKFNLELSKKRAASVKKYFVDKGIESSRLVSDGFGSSRPIATNDTPEGMSLNRRVDLKFIF